MTDEELNEAASRAKHTPLSADPYTRGLARHIEALVQEVRRLRDREVKLISDGVARENDLSAARAEVERLKMELAQVPQLVSLAAGNIALSHADKLRGMVERQRAEVQRLGQQVRQAGDSLAEANRRREEAAKEVERLRATRLVGTNIELRAALARACELLTNSVPLPGQGAKVEAFLREHDKEVKP